MSGCTHKSFGEHLTYLVYGLRYWFDIVCAVVRNYNNISNQTAWTKDLTGLKYVSSAKRIKLVTHHC
jgi:hypothetical protein